MSAKHLAPASPAKSMSHDEANYRMTLSLVRRCSLCSMYTPGRSPSCSLVVKPINPGGVCDYFKKMEDK